MFKVPEQKRVSPFLGGLKELVSRVMFYAGIINFILIVVTAYHTSIKDIMPVPFLAFFSILIVGLLVAMVFEYIIVLPSSVAFSNRQSYKHDNPIRSDMLKILKKLDDIEKETSQRLDSIEKETLRRLDSIEKETSKKLDSIENEIKILKENDRK